MKIKTGDRVMVIAGKDKGKTGKVLQAFPAIGKVVVEGVNTATKYMRARGAGAKGQKIQFSGPLHVSNVMLIDPKSQKPTRVKIQVAADGKKTRVAAKSGEPIA